MRYLLIALIAVPLLIGAVRLVQLGQAELRRDRPMLPVTFAHADHVTVNCVVCHHNFIDQTGSGLCFDCHKRESTVSALVETQFHDLCMGCHEARQAAGEDGGPTRQCDACHTADDAP